MNNYFALAGTARPYITQHFNSHDIESVKVTWLAISRMQEQQSALERRYVKILVWKRVVFAGSWNRVPVIGE